MSVQTEQTITSLEVAELTGKQHKHVLADIRNILSQMDEISRPNFRPSTYTSDRGKQHKHVLADIRNILSQMDEISLLNFQESTYTSDRGKEYPMFNLTKEGCLCLVSGYDANLRMKIMC